MKKYIEIQKHEELADGDECRYVYSEEWRSNIHSSQMAGFEYRRPVPHTGDVQFLMAVSILVPVIVNCDGLAQDEIEMIAGDAVIHKIKGEIDSYICHENIDWDGSMVDEVQPEPKIPGKYRMLEANEPIVDGDEYQTEAGGWNPLLHMGQGVGTQLPHKRYRRPITNEPKYRPFGIGEVIEDGDEVLSRNGVWTKFAPAVFGHTIESSFVMTTNARKLIK